MEVHGGEGVQRFFQYIADRTDIALGLFNSGSSGYALAPDEVARIANEIPAVCAMKEGMMEAWRSKAAARARARARHLGVRRHRLQGGVVAAGNRRAPPSWVPPGTSTRRPRSGCSRGTGTSSWDGRLAEAIEYEQATGLGRISEELGPWFTGYPGRPGYFTHWGEAFRHAAFVIGLPIGDYPHSRPPQGILPQAGKDQIRKTLENAGLAKQPAPA